MFKPGTILELKKQRPAATRTNRDGEVITDEKDKPIKFDFPYNKVRVIGESPIDHGLGGGAGWEGVGARGVIIEPLTEFAGNLDEPYGKLQQLYNVVSIPEPVVVRPEVRVTVPGDLGPTPEETFAKDAPGKAQPGRTRARSPLGDVESPDASPLKASAPAAPAPVDTSPL